MKSLKEIAEKFDLDLDNLKKHYKNHVIRHLEPVITYVNAEDVPIILVRVDGEDCHVPAEVLIKEVKKSRMTVCVTEEELEKGRKHTAKVREYYRGMGDLKTFKQQIKYLLKEYPGFRPVI